jgi:hypothetical protein
MVSTEHDYVSGGVQPSTEASKLIVVPAGSITAIYVGGADMGTVHWAISRA